VCASRDWDDIGLRALMAEIDPTAAHRRHRKDWEFAVGLAALERAGVLGPESEGASVGAGHEVVLYHLANRVGRVFATDLYGNDSWSQGEGDGSMLVDPDLFAPYPYRRGRLVVCHMDALDLRFEDGSLDWAVSFGSIEHFGGPGPAQAALAEIARVLRPGGAAAVTTELAVDGGPHRAFENMDLFDLATLQALLDGEPRLELLDGFDLSIPDDPAPPVPLVREGRLAAYGASTDLHTRVTIDGRVFSSVMLAVVKPR
jgi:SAM-dependent methyltransferase